MSALTYLVPGTEGLVSIIEGIEGISAKDIDLLLVIHGIADADTSD